MTTNEVAQGHAPPLEIRPIFRSGDPNNRIDFVFFGDGYTESEKSKFFDDAARLAGEIAQNQTFYTVKPLLNFWAAFTPSVEVKGTELRGVYYARPEVARLACTSLGSQCDYPVLLGNDPYYGGLGGEFTVITPSVKNGALVLRHELGHSIIEIGEEYDGGVDGGYFGVDAANSPETIGWRHWLTNPPAPGEIPRVERMVMSFQAYPWTTLNVSTVWTGRFLSSGTYPSNFIRFSIAGIPRSDQLTVRLDGKDIGWAIEEGVGRDRYFYQYLDVEGGGFGDREHEIQFVLNYDDPDRTTEGSGPQLCSIEVLEYGAPHEFNGSLGHYGVFPTFSATNRTTYRPTNEDCLMRDVVIPDFCKVCIEELWLRLLKRVSIIENAESDCRSFIINLLPLAQFRTNETLVGTEESYEIVWSRKRKGQEDWILENFSGKTELALSELDDIKSGDVIAVAVRFVTEEVRLDEKGYLRDSMEWTIGSECKSGWISVQT
ncbi:hypothetical protein BDM02DRAFT_3154243 [Thelephora ganbajun]|uniref:Uncharacterized protein n=1 Tax=Thelephora ganbajun TaxID=370292 RepID=A0ACB6ZQF0_THEGA|nr:hypothetical protein BDM02DRAFT_3154243 [Thelephora ganbajun]